MVRALRVVLNQAQDFIAADDVGALLSNHIALALALTSQLCQVIGLDERDTVMEYGAAIAAALFPLGTSFCEVEGVPISVDPEGTYAKAWDIPGAGHFPLPLNRNAESLSERIFCAAWTRCSTGRAPSGPGCLAAAVRSASLADGKLRPTADGHGRVATSCTPDIHSGRIACRRGWPRCHGGSE